MTAKPNSGILSRAIVLPIVTRELRVLSRRPMTYYARMFAAAMGVVLAAYIFLLISNVSMKRNEGMLLFCSLSSALFFWAVSSAWAGCDSISVEKRDGTIGFLFLTDLKSHDIVLGKLFSSALPAFYGMLAVMPLLAVCMLMGGVTPAQYAETGLALLNIFFLIQAIGMFSSALCRSRGGAMGVPLLILGLYLICIGLAESAKEHGWWSLAGFLQLNDPFRPFYLALIPPSLIAVLGVAGLTGYWPCLLVGQLHAWIFLGLAIRVLPRRWQDKPRKINAVKAMWEKWRFGNMAARAKLRRRLAGINPFLWLVCRRRFNPVYIWILMGFFSAPFAIGLALGDVGDYAGCFLGIIVLLQLILRVGISSFAALLEEQRRDGSLEILLCCTPLSAEDILGGMWLGMRRYFFWPTMALIGMEAFLFVAALLLGRRSGEDVDVLCFLCISAILLIPDLLAIGWMAMWLAISSRKPRSAGSSALLFITGIPWMPVMLFCAYFDPGSGLGPANGHWVWPLWLVSALTIDITFGCFARKQLRQNFRLWAVPSYGEVLGFWGLLGRFLGWHARPRTSDIKPAA